MNKPFMIIGIVASLLLLGAVAVLAGEPASPPYGATVTTIEAELPTCSTVILLTVSAQLPPEG